MSEVGKIADVLNCSKCTSRKAPPDEWHWKSHADEFCGDSGVAAGRRNTFTSAMPWGSWQSGIKPDGA
jgi:hypothetical protein